MSTEMDTYATKWRMEIYNLQAGKMDLMEPPACMRSPVANKSKGWFAHMVGMALSYRA